MGNKGENHKIKCVIWDLDNTVWNGTLLEDKEVTLREGIIETIKELDDRGILQSISSKNNHVMAFEKLQELKISEYFLYPQINWNSKSSSIKKIVESLNIGINTIAFVDDQPFEREEVEFELPEVLCIDALAIDSLLDMPEMNPLFITDDSKMRRQLYISDIKRKEIESEFEGPTEDFLASLEMELTINPIDEDDLKRAEELTVRTSQLNSTGYTFSYEELEQLRHSENHKLLIVELNDKYGTYGKIGLVLIECFENEWHIKLLLMSCRVMSRGIGSIIINYIMNAAAENNVKLKAEFVETDRNRMMYITYKFANFKEVEKVENHVIFEADLSRVQDYPDYVKLNILDKQNI